MPEDKLMYKPGLIVTTKDHRFGGVQFKGRFFEIIKFPTEHKGYALIKAVEDFRFESFNRATFNGIFLPKGYFILTSELEPPFVTKVREICTNRGR